MDRKISLSPLIKIVGSFIFLFLINWMLALPLLALVVLMIVLFLSSEPPDAGDLYG